MKHVMNMLLTSKTCATCPAMKETLKKLKVPFLDLDIADTLGRHFSKIYDIQGVPYFAQTFRGRKINHLFGNCPFDYVQDRIIPGGEPWKEE